MSYIYPEEFEANCPKEFPKILGSCQPCKGRGQVPIEGHPYDLSMPCGRCESSGREPREMTTDEKLKFLLNGCHTRGGAGE